MTALGGKISPTPRERLAMYRVRSDKQELGDLLIFIFGQISFSELIPLKKWTQSKLITAPRR